jgi:hypothetical protein
MQLTEIKAEMGFEPTPSSLGIWAYFVNKEHMRPVRPS